MTKETKRTPLYEAHLALKGQMVDYAGWAMPASYTGLAQEHEAVRTAVGMFDCSHMGQILVTGPDAQAYGEYLLTNRLDAPVGKCTYACMLNEAGGVVDDLIVYRQAEDAYLWVVNAANAAKDLAWMEDHMEGFDVTVADLSDDYALIAVQGPKAEEVLQTLVDVDLKEIAYYAFKEDVKVLDTPCLVSRTGYTGEDGFEIYAPPSVAMAIWEALLEKEVTPCGLGCRDTLRFEAGMPLYGNEMDESVTPLEAGLKFSVKFDKEAFIGKEALEKALEEGTSRKLMALELDGRGIPRQGYLVFDGDEEVGVITTGYLSPSTGRPLANVRLTKDLKIGDPVQVQIRKKSVDAHLVSRKFLK